MVNFSSRFFRKSLGSVVIDEKWLARFLKIHSTSWAARYVSPPIALMLGAHSFKGRSRMEVLDKPISYFQMGSLPKRPGGHGFFSFGLKTPKKNSSSAR